MEKISLSIVPLKFKNMPRIYEYFGIYLLFYSNDNQPIHVHALTKDGREVKVIFHTKKSKIVRIVYKDTKGGKTFTKPQMKNLKVLINQEKMQIVNAWIKFFILKDTIKLRKITQKIK